MRINEIILEQELDEGIGQAIGKAWGGLAKGVGATVGGLAGTWDAAKQGYRAGKAAVAGRENPDDSDPTLTKNQSQQAAGGTQQAASGETTPAAGGTQQAASGSAPAQAAAPAASSTELDQLKATLGKLNPDQKKELAGELEKSMNAPAAQSPAQGQQTGAAPSQGQPAAQSPAQGQPAAPAQSKADRDAADRAEADKQIAATKAANAAAAQADNELVAAVKAAKAKPGFQQTAQDKLTIQKGAAKGIHESKNKKKKKIVAEFNSKFLGMKI